MCAGFVHVQCRSCAVLSQVSTHGHLDFTGQTRGVGAYMEKPCKCALTIPAIHRILKKWGVGAYSEEYGICELICECKRSLTHHAHTNIHTHTTQRTHTRTHARTHARTHTHTHTTQQHARTHTHATQHTHARTHARTRTHTHTHTRTSVRVKRETTRTFVSTSFVPGARRED